MEDIQIYGGVLGARSFGLGTFHCINILTGHVEDFNTILLRVESYGRNMIPLEIQSPRCPTSGIPARIDFRLLKFILHTVVGKVEIFRRHDVQVAPLAVSQLVVDLGPSVFVDSSQILFSGPSQRVILAHFRDLFDMSIQI